MLMTRVKRAVQSLDLPVFRDLVDYLLRLQLFFFSSRRRHTSFDCDWSSDVCSSDLMHGNVAEFCVDQYDETWYKQFQGKSVTWHELINWPHSPTQHPRCIRGGSYKLPPRSEERRVGKSVDLGGRRIIKKKKREIMRL